jgi:hypothetical protein
LTLDIQAMQSAFTEHGSEQHLFIVKNLVLTHTTLWDDAEGMFLLAQQTMRLRPTSGRPAVVRLPSAVTS